MNMKPTDSSRLPGIRRGDVRNARGEWRAFHGAALKSQSGSTLVIVVVFIVALFGFAALSIDVGNVYVLRKFLHEGTDAAALAAVIDWASGGTPAQVAQVGTDFCRTNGVQVAEIVSIEPGTWVNSTKTFVGPLASLPANSVPAVRIVGRRNVKLGFAGVVGLREMNPVVESIAIVAAPQGVVNALPFAACDQSGVIATTRCSLFTLKYGSSGGGAINSCFDSFGQSGFGALRFEGDSGANDYRDNIIYGYREILRIGDCVRYESGNMPQPTFQGLGLRVGSAPPYTCTVSPPSPAPDNGRLAIVPKVRSIDGSPAEVCIEGFYVIVIDSWDKSGNIVTVNARFLEVYSGVEVDPNLPPKPGELKGLALVR